MTSRLQLTLANVTQSSHLHILRLLIWYCPNIVKLTQILYIVVPNTLRLKP